MSIMRQEAPFPGTLVSLLSRLNYSPPRQKWTWRLEDDYCRGQGSKGLTLIIEVETINSYPPHNPVIVWHYMPVPPASYDERSWKWWLFQQIGLIEQHERMEFFRIDGEPVYPPAHGPGNDPYLILDYGSDLDRRTQFDGTVDPE